MGEVAEGGGWNPQHCGGGREFGVWVRVSQASHNTQDVKTGVWMMNLSIFVCFKNDGEVSYFDIGTEVSSHHHETIASGLGGISVVVTHSFCSFSILFRKIAQGYR